MGCSVMGKLRSALVSSRGASWLVSRAAASESMRVELLPELRLVALEGFGSGFEGFVEGGEDA